MNKNQLLKELTVTFVQEVLIKEALTPEKEQEYIDAIQSGSGPARERAMKKLLNSFQNLIFKNAQKLKGGAKAGVEMEDLVNAGREGLLKAINSYDPEFGTKLSTHAYRMVFDEMYKQAQQGRAVTLPANVVVLKSKIEKASQKFQAENGYEPSPEELEDILGIPAQEIVDAMAAKGGAASLDTPVGGEDGLDTGDTKADFLADPTNKDTDVDDAGGESTRKELDDLFDKAKLSANQREIINTYLTALKTAPEKGVAKTVAQKLGKSQMNVSAAIKNIEKKLGLADKGVKLSSLREYAEKRALLREVLRKEVRAILNEGRTVNEADQMDVDVIFDIVKQASTNSGESLVRECEDLFSKVLDLCKKETADQIARQRANVFVREDYDAEKQAEKGREASEAELEARYEDYAKAEYGKSFDKLNDEERQDVIDQVKGELGI